MGVRTKAKSSRRRKVGSRPPCASPVAPPSSQVDLPIRFHPAFGFYTCTRCNVPSFDIRAHLSAGGPHSSEYLSCLAELDEHLTRHPARDPDAYLPDWVSARRPYPEHIPGIPSSSSGHACGICYFVHPLRHLVIDHICEQHPSHLYLQACGPVSYIQRFFDEPEARWFASSAPEQEEKGESGQEGAPAVDVTGVSSDGAEGVEGGVGGSAQSDPVSKTTISLVAEHSTQATSVPSSKTTPLSASSLPPPRTTHTPPPPPSRLPPLAAPRKRDRQAPATPFPPPKSSFWSTVMGHTPPPPVTVLVRAKTAKEGQAYDQLRQKLVAAEIRSDGAEEVIRRQRARIRQLEDQLASSRRTDMVLRDAITWQSESIEALEKRVRILTDELSKAYRRAGEGGTGIETYVMADKQAALDVGVDLSMGEYPNPRGRMDLMEKTEDVEESGSEASWDSRDGADGVDDGSVSPRYPAKRVLMDDERGIGRAAQRGSFDIEDDEVQVKVEPDWDVMD